MESGSGEANAIARGERSCTALMQAAFTGHFDIVKRLLKAGADINIRDKDGLSALTLAIRKRHFETAKFLVSEGADVISGDAGGRTPLMWAASASCVRLAERLLDRGADVNAKGVKDGRTALMEAYRKGHKDVAKWLERRGAVHSTSRKF